MCHSGPYPDEGRSFETTMNVGDLRCLGYSAEIPDPPADDFLALPDWILVEFLYLVDSSGGYPAYEPEEDGSAGSIERASYARTGAFLETNVFTSSVVFYEE